MCANDKTAFGRTTYFIQSPDGEPFPLQVQGRIRWALECLLAARVQGCTPIDTPRPRWSSCIHNLRQIGVRIRTVHEDHDGPFRGNHARYVLKSVVTRAVRIDGGAL